MNCISTLALTAALATAGTTASATILLNQPVDPNATSTGPVNNHQPVAQFGSQTIVHNVTDVTVGALDWEVDTISVFVTPQPFRGNPQVSGMPVFVTVEEITAGLPGGNPTTSPILNTTTIIGSNFDPFVELSVDVSSLGIVLEAGKSYWIGVTPNVQPSLTGGGPGNLMMAAPGQQGTASPGAVYFAGTAISPGQNYQPPAGFVAPGWYAMIDGDGSNTSTDLAIKIQGTEVPEPTSLALLALGGLLAARRRRG